MSEAGIVIGTFGDPEWWDKAKCARRSVQEQTVLTPWTHIHAETLQQARNQGARDLVDNYGVEFLIFLDADDALERNYVEEMLKGTGDVRQPSTFGVYPDGTTDDAPALIPERRGGLLMGNHLVIGSMVRSDLFFEVGGFDDLPILEDWDLWIRCWQAGAQITTCPGAIYRVGVNEGSRNNQVDHDWVYRQIRQKYGKRR